MARLPPLLSPLFPIVKQASLTAAEVFGPLRRLLTRPLGKSAPPRKVAPTTEGYAASHPEAGIVHVPLLPRVEITRELPSGLPRDHWVFPPHRSASVPPAFLARVPNGRAVGHYGAAITHDDTLLFDLSPYFGAIRPAQHPIFLRFGLPPVRDVTGAVGLLTTRGVDNYYHFLLDVIPRLELLRLGGLQVDTYLVNQSLRFQGELLRTFGVPADRVLQSSDNPHLRAQMLVVPSLPDNEMRTPGWIVALLRDRLLPPNLDGPHRRIYVGRGRCPHTRMVRNEEGLLNMLSHHGVTPVDPGRMSVREQVRLFAEAELVIAAHGAALTNLVFCSPGTRIVELFAPDYVNVCFWALSTQVGGLDYRYLVGDGPGHRPGRPMLGVSSDISVNLPRLCEILEDAR